MADMRTSGGRWCCGADDCWFLDQRSLSDCATPTNPHTSASLASPLCFVFQQKFFVKGSVEERIMEVVKQRQVRAVAVNCHFSIYSLRIHNQTC